MRAASAATLLALAGLLGMSACAGGEGTSTDGEGAEEVRLGPMDGQELPPTDLDRIQDGDVAPDFTLAAYEGPPITLSDFRGEKNVVLVFYRGHW